MPCGCQKNKKNAALPPPVQAARPAREVGRVAVYEVRVGNETKLATTSASAARAESSRLGGSVRVTSRPIEAGDPVPA